MLEMFIKWFYTHCPHPFSDQITDRVIDHRRGDAGLQAEAVCQIGRHIELSAADMDLHSVALRKGMIPGSRRWISAPREISRSQLFENV